MYAVQFKEFGSPDVLTLDWFTEPHANAGEVRIRVRAAGVSPVDVASLDAAGAGSLPELIEITGAAASVLTIADFSAPKLGVPLSLGALGGQAHGEHGLAVAGELARAGRFHVAISADHPMVRAADAHAAIELGPPRPGKTVLVAPDQPIRTRT